MESAHWIYAVLVLATMPPMVPNSALVAGAGAMAAAGGLSLPLLVVVLLLSTVTGDLGTFWAGRRSRGRALGWLCRRPARRSMLEWTASRFRRYGVPSVIAVRFVPGGRGVGGLTAGVVGYPVHGYLLGAAVAEAIFVSYTVGLGYLGGRFALDGVARWLVGPVVSLLVAGVVLGVQRVHRHRTRGSGAAGPVRPDNRTKAGPESHDPESYGPESHTAEPPAAESRGPALPDPELPGSTPPGPEPQEPGSPDPIT